MSIRTAFRKTRAIAPLHTSGPFAVTNDGTRLFTCVGDEVVLTHIETGTEICKFKGDTTSITSLTISPSSTHLVVFYTSLVLRVYAIPTTTAPIAEKVAPTRTVTHAHEAPVHICRIDESSNLLASGAADGVAKVWDINRGYVTHVFKGHGGVLSALAFSTVGESSQRRVRLITGSADTRIRIFDLSASSSRSAGAKPQAVLEGHVSVPRGLAVTPDGKWLLSSGRDAVVLVWEIAVGEGSSETKLSGKGKGKAKAGANHTLTKTIPVFERVEALGLLDPSEVLAQSSNASSTQLLFFTGGEKGAVRIWDAWSGSVIASYGGQGTQVSEELEEQRQIVDAQYIPSTSTIASMHADQNILFHSLRTGALTHQLVGFNDEIIDATFLSPFPNQTDSHLAIATNSSLIRIYSTANLDARLLSSHTDMVLCLDRGANGRILASGSKDKSARVWAATTTPEGACEWTCVAICEGHAESVGAIALSRKSEGDGEKSECRFMFTGSQDRTIKMWDLSNLSNRSKPTSLVTHKAHEKDINSLDVSPNDRLLATGSQDKTAKIFEIEHIVTSAGVRGDVRLLGICKGHKRGVWNTKFSRTERVLATGSGDKSIKLWSLDDFTCLKTFEGHTNSVLRIDFINQGLQLVSSASDGLVKLWNVRNEECLASMDNHEDKVWALAVSTDERTLVSGAADSVITFWTDCTEEQVQEKEAKRAELVLKEQDFNNYISLQDYRNAILLALSMDQPGRLLNLFKSIYASRSAEAEKSGPSITGNASVDQVIKTLPAPDLARLMTHIQYWNASARTSHIAQTILYAILKFRTAEDIAAAFDVASDFSEMVSQDVQDLDLDDGNAKTNRRKAAERGVAKETGGSLKSLVDGLIPYTERHFARADRMVQDSFILDYVLGEMDSGLSIDELPMDLDTPVGA